MQPNNFSNVFGELTGSSPFPWQEALFARFIAGEIPDAANLPTGLGKTSIVDI
jgi:CRISPR-associated endonuclease/helicase Cas3